MPARRTQIVLPAHYHTSGEPWGELKGPDSYRRGVIDDGILWREHFASGDAGVCLVAAVEKPPARISW